MPIFSHNFSGLYLGQKKPNPSPLVIEDDLGRFTLNDPGREDSYWGEVLLLGKSVSVCLKTDGDEKMTAVSALNNLHAFAANVADWDAEIKRFAADDFANKDGMIETWGSCDNDGDGERISKEEFMRRINLNFICFYSDGSIFLDYSLDDMFTDHGLGVNADISGNIESCALWG